MTDMRIQHYNRLENGPMDEIDAAVWSGDIFFVRENIAAFRDMMARWERGLKEAEDVITKMEKENEKRMTKRIEQLKHQASLWCDMNIPEKFSEENGYGSTWEDKFAELIVKECAEYVDTLLGDVDNPHYPDGEMIKEHFGVKE